MKEELTFKQAEFVRLYLLYGNATKAAIGAGYSEKGADKAGYRLLQDARIKEAVNDFRRKKEEEALAAHKEITKQFIMTYEDMIGEFKHLKDKAEQDKKYSAAAKALENICKMMGFFERKDEDKVNGYDVDIPKDVENEG